MLQELSTFSRLKDSGLKWVGRVPEHWQVQRAKTYFREINERSIGGKEELLSVSHKTGVTPRREKNVTMFLAESNVGDKICRPGDVVVNTMWAWMAAMGVSAHRGIVSPSYGVFRPSKPDLFLAEYLDPLLRTPPYRSEYVSRSTGITSSRLRLYPDQFLRIPILRPPPDEQAAIVKFLGYANGRIRRYIQAKLKLIKLLEEQKQAIIHRAVTRGLDPNVKFKPSGVEWLGDIPEHWKCAALGRFLRRIEQGWSPVSAEGEINDDQWVVTSLSAVTRGHFNSGAIKPIRRSETIPTQLQLNKGDLLMTRSNTRDRVGDVCIVEGARSRTIFSDLIYRLNLTAKVLPQYVAWVLLSRVSRIQIEMSARGSSGTMPKLAHRHIRSIRIAVPPQDEQAQIVSHIAERSKAFDDATNQARREIELLREYRTRLTADVVTGQLDVREAASKLPETIDEQEADAGLDEENDDLDEDEDEGMES